jgi:hypothetical protein
MIVDVDNYRIKSTASIVKKAEKERKNQQNNNNEITLSFLNKIFSWPEEFEMCEIYYTILNCAIFMYISLKRSIMSLVN